MGELPPNTLLGGRYQILGPLGAGGMANVYRARDLNLQREVAIKILRDDLVSDPAFQARFLHEARAAANLLHPNIVTVYDFGQEAGRTYMAMEYVQGTDLKTLLRRRGTLPIEESLGLVIQACAAVGYAHRAGLIHCDLKPQNILVTPDGRAKITDFGIARALVTIHPEEFSDVVWGSPQYFAPEQAAGGPPSPASDVYSLGIILYEVLTGRLPFEATDSAQLARMHLSATPPSPRSMNPAIPLSLEQIVYKVLSKEPSARYRTADQLGRVLMTFAPRSTLAEMPPQALAASSPGPQPEASTAPMEKPEPTPMPVDWLAVALGLLALLAVGGLIPLWLWACLMYPSCPLRLP
jgi:serine/threonine protein kinase